MAGFQEPIFMRGRGGSHGGISGRRGGLSGGNVKSDEGLETRVID